ncbi:MAG: XisI protein [Thermoanaerobaculia bacterium]|nr:XisI protein [Thermoanaerobaculia bacterium]
MDKIKKYQEIIEGLLEEYAAQMSQGKEMPENQVISEATSLSIIYNWVGK